MNAAHADRFRKTTQALRISLLAIISRVDELTDLIECLPLDAPSPVPLLNTDPSISPRLDRATYTVQWAERSCSLGYTMAYRMSFKLKKKRVLNPPEMWVRADGAFDGVVNPESFFMARGIMQERYLSQRHPDILGEFQKLADSPDLKAGS